MPVALLNISKTNKIMLVTIPEQLQNVNCPPLSITNEQLIGIYGEIESRAFEEMGIVVETTLEEAHSDPQIFGSAIIRASDFNGFF